MSYHLDLKKYLKTIPNNFIIFKGMGLILVLKKTFVATPLWDKCEDETHTPKSGKLESFGTPENSELEFKGQNIPH